MWFIVNKRKFNGNRKAAIFLLCLALIFQWIPVTNSFADDSAGLTEGAAHSYYKDSEDSIQSNYGKGDYLYSTLTVTGEELGSEQIFSVMELETLAYENDSDLGYEGNYSFRNSGGTYSSQVMTGIKLYDFLVDQCGMSSSLPDDTVIKYIAKDGYSSTITVGDLKSTGYSYYKDGETTSTATGLPVLISFGSNGLPLVGPTGDESVTKSFTTDEGIVASALNSGGPLKITIGQTDSSNYNAMLNGKWITKIVVGDDTSYTQHTSAEQAVQALTVKVYENSAATPVTTKNYTLGTLESFAEAATANQSKNYYYDDNYYEGVNLWSLISGDTDLGLSSYDGDVVLNYDNDESETIDLSYLQNSGGSYSNYITTKNGSTITCVKPILAYGKNGEPTSGGALYACLPVDGTYKSTATVKECTEICLYVGTPTDTHNSDPYSDYIDQTIEITGSGIKTSGNVSVGTIEQNISLMFSDTYTQDSVPVTFGGINLYRFLESRKLTVDAENVIIRNASGSVELSLSELEADSDNAMLAFSKNGVPLVQDTSSDGYAASSGNSGGPILFVSSSKYLENITSIEVTIAAGQWNHFDGNPDLYESYLDDTTLRIHGTQAKDDVTLTLRELEERTDDIVRDSYAAGGGSFGFEGVILRELLNDYLADGVSEPSKITVIGDGGFQKDLDVDDVYDGIESQYQTGEVRDIILAYGINGVPLVPTSGSIGYDGTNAYGPLRLVVENTISSWVKGVSEIIIGGDESENANYTISYFQTKARSANSDKEIPGLGYTAKTESGTVGDTVTITPPEIPGWTFAGYEDKDGTFYEAASGSVQLALSADETQNKVTLRYNLNAGFLIVGDSLSKNYWYSYEDLQDMAENAADYAILNADNFYTTNLYSVIKRGGVPSNMFGAGIDLSELLSGIGGSGTQKVTLYSADGGTSNYGGASNLFDFSTNSFSDQGYYYYPDVLANGASATETGKTAVLPMLAFKVKDIGWTYSDLDSLGAPTDTSVLLDQPTVTEDVLPVKEGILGGTEDISAWDSSSAYPYPFLMTGQTSPGHFNNSDYFKMLHGIAAGSVGGLLTISKSSTWKTFDPITFVKNGFEPVSFSTDTEGISIVRLATLSGITLKSGDTISFTGQASSVVQATSSTFDNYYIALNVNASTNELDRSDPFILVHKNGSSVETATISGIQITSGSTDSEEEESSGGGGGVAAEEETYDSPSIPWVDLIVDEEEAEEESAAAVETISATTDSTGNAQAEISVQDISSSLKDVLAERANENVIAEIRIQVNSSSDAKQLAVKMPVSALKDLTAKSNTQLCVETEFGDFQFTDDVLNQMISQSDGEEITVNVSLLTGSELSNIPNGDQYARGVYDLSLQSGGSAITNFGDADVTVGLPYQLANGENAAGVYAYYIDSDGKASVILNSKYDAKNKRVVFQTNHFSNYAIGYDENAISQIFKDVASTYWAADAIGYVAGKGLFQGVSETNFAPQNSMTRGMFVTVLARLSGKDVSGETGNFTDVKAGQWYTDSVNWAANNGIVEGYANNIFKPDQMVTREQMAVFLYRYAKWAGYDVTTSTNSAISSFNDSSEVSVWANEALVWAAGQSLISGVSTDTLDPQGQATRSQVAAISQRFSEKIIPVAATVSGDSSAASDSSGTSSDSETSNKYSSVPTGDSYLTVKGSGLNDTIYLTYDDLESMGTVTITYTGRNKENDNKRQYLKFTGVNLASILNASGWNGTGTTMKVVCSDGYTKKYELSEIMEDYVSFLDDEDTQGYWVPAIVALVDEDTFRLVFGQEDSDADTTMSFNMQGWANHLLSIEIY